uniref:Uncharacterized protein n=1 Tax=Anguilla anguilla TaxID=7936 RepID=A0A0E9UPE5_ANGAN
MGEHYNYNCWSMSARFMTKNNATPPGISHLKNYCRFEQVGN